MAVSCGELRHMALSRFLSLDMALVRVVSLDMALARVVSLDMALLCGELRYGCLVS